MQLLSKFDIDSRLRALSEWKIDSGLLVRTFAFKDFRSALSFVNQVGELAEEAGHHPDIDIRYSRVRLGLTTHDAGGLTAKDFELADCISRLI